jgi:diguanylate cyclase (GGDEF)-like protein
LVLDPLTWLPDRAAFEGRLAQAVSAIRRPRTALALALIDLDRIEDVNRTVGREIGDRLLHESAARMARVLGPSATLSCFGGDDFAAFMQVGDLEDAMQHAVKLLTRCREPFVIDCLSINVTASIGIALYPTHADNAADLMQRAERALFEAKTRGRNCLYPGPTSPR